MWPELIPALCGQVSGEANDVVKQSSLSTLGYICEEIEPEHLKDASNAILTAVVQGMRPEQKEDVRLAATQAMLNALEFVKTNFEAEQERNYIMQTVCETTQATNVDLQKAAYEVIVRVAELYYEHLAAYMQALFGLTTAVITQATQKHAEDEDQDLLGQQAIEFWTTVCDEEIERMDDARDAGTDPSKACSNYVKGAAPHLLPLMLEALCLQEEDAEDEDSWNMAMASATCISRIAQTIEDDVVAIATPFIQQHLVSDDWRRCEAASLAFGSILDGPSVEKFYNEDVSKNMVAWAIEILLTRHINHANLQVKDTASWTIGRICEHHVRAIPPGAHWDNLMRQLLSGLTDHPRVAKHLCFALHNLAESCEDSESSPLTPHFVAIVQQLLVCADRPDGAGQAQLRTNAYEALNALITNGSDSVKEAIKQLLPPMKDRLQAALAMQIVSNDDRDVQTELIGLICGTLQVITQKLQSDVPPESCDQMMTLFLQVLGIKSSTVHEEALMAVGAVANATEKGFVKYMQYFRPFLSLGLSNVDEHQVCSIAVGVVGDVCRALEEGIIPFCDEIVQLLLRNLQNQSLNRNVKPAILACFGDIALAVSGAFEKYMAITMEMLVQASMTVVDENNPDLLDYLHQLQEGILEAYTGILQGLRAGEKAGAFVPYAGKALDFLDRLGAQSESLSDEVIRAAVGVVGDLASTLGQQFIPLCKQTPHKDYLNKLLKAAKESQYDATKQVAQWAKQQIK